jgi:hypothetical protein
MTRTRAFASVRIATAVTGCALSVALGAPVAHADDPLPGQNATITGDRHKYGPACPPLKFNPVLEAVAQGLAQLIEDPPAMIDADRAKYQGELREFKGNGDPQAAALTNTYNAGAGGMLDKCDWTEFGSGFHRFNDRDYVAIVFGKPAPAAPPPGAGTQPGTGTQPGAGTQPGTGTQPGAGTLPPVQCPDGSSVPAGQACPVIAPPPPLPVTDAIRLSFGKPNISVFGSSITATVKNSSGLTASCTYDASGLAATHRDFTVGPKVSTDLKFDGTATGSTYHVVVSCHDASGTQPQEIGHQETDVTF